MGDDHLMEAETSVPTLWRELDDIRKNQGLSYGQLRIKLIGAGTKISLGTLSDRLRNGRITSWANMQPVVTALGQDEFEWRERYERAQRKIEERSAWPRKLPLGPARRVMAEPWWTRRRRPRIVVGLAAVIILVLVAVFVQPSWLSGSTRVQDVGCARVSGGIVRVYDEPGNRKHSFAKYEGERIQIPIPPHEITGQDGVRYLRVLTPSRRDGYGWIPSDTTNLRKPC